MTVLCTRTPGVACVRRPGHKGCCTACPSAATLDWDIAPSPIAQRHLDAAAILAALDFATPVIDLNDPL